MRYRIVMDLETDHPTRPEDLASAIKSAASAGRINPPIGPWTPVCEFQIARVVGAIEVIEG